MAVWDNKLVVAFGGDRNLYACDVSWTWLSNKDDVPAMIVWGNGLGVDFGPGDGVYRYNGAWNLIRSWSTAA